MTQLLPVVVLGAFAWLWWDSVRAREIAVRAAAAACRSCRVQFLDQTVALRRTRLRRNRAGQLQVFRKYVFEFSTSGNEREHGYAIMMGRRLAELHLDLVLDGATQTTSLH